MVLYAGIDLHSNNNVVVVQDRDDNVVGRHRLPNDPFIPPRDTTGLFLERPGTRRRSPVFEARSKASGQAGVSVPPARIIPPGPRCGGTFISPGGQHL